VATLLSEIIAGNFANYGGKVEALGLVGTEPAANYVQLAPSTQWADGFTEADYADLVAKMFNGEITVSDAIDAMPFLTERSFIEVRGLDTNKLPEAEAARFVSLISDIPDYCTLALVMGTEFSPDGRLKVTKALKKSGELLEFSAQDGDSLIKWIARRFDAWEKRISRTDAEYLITITGGLMNRMIPEIDKISAYAKDSVVTRADIDAVTEKVPDAVVFEMTDLLAAGDADGAMGKLAELLTDKNNVPIMLLAVVGQQLRRLYAAKVAASEHLGVSDVMELCGLRFDFIAQKLTQSARRYSMAQLEHAVQLCAETDYAMKRSGTDNAELLKELLLRLLAEASI
jgi:DNA polymerase-3 subunit delta